MLVLNESGLTPGWFVTRVSPHPLSATLLLKGTFDFVPKGPVRPADEPLPLDGDVHEDGDPHKPLRYASDFAWYKPHADVTLVGTAHVPEGKPNIVCSVGLRVGNWSKRLAVLGDRRRTRSMLVFSKDSEPAPFVKKRLSYVSSFGGPGFARNPAGVGHADVVTPQGERMRPLPNIIDYGALQDDAAAEREPAGFGPIAMTWPQRMGRAGTYDAAWLKTQWPGFPRDFDWTFFNAAPRDQQSPFLRGDERIALENLHPSIPGYETRLPGLRTRWLMHERVGGQPRLRLVTMNLDTLWIDADAEKLVLVWRGVVDIRDRKLSDVVEHFMITEPLAEPQRPIEHYASLLEKARLKARGGPPPVPEPVPPEPPPAPGTTEATDRELREMLGGVKKHELDARDKIAKAPLRVAKPAMLDAPPPSGDPLADLRAKISQALAGGRLPPDANARLGALDGEIASLLSLSSRIDAAAASAPVPSMADPTAGVWTRERCEQHAAQGGDFSDLDLSGLDLSKMSFDGLRMHRAMLADANLTGASLEKTDLQGAVLSRAKLAGVRARGADLRSADLTEAVLEKADLAGANLDGADFSKARLPGALFQGASARGTIFFAANLAGTRWDKANLLGADLSEAALEKAVLAGASLVSADATKAKGPEADLRGADLSRFAAPGANFARAQFEGARAPWSVWEGASLDDANFARVPMQHVVLESASAKRAVFAFADLSRGTLADAHLERANLLKANLFRANLEGSYLTGAQFVGANLHEAEFLDALTESAEFRDAILTGTKLA